MLLRKALMGAVIALFLITSAHAAQKVEVVTTIKPIHSFLAALMKGVGEPSLLMEDKSPYDYQPSDKDIALINKADLIVWIGPELESSLAPLLKPSMNVFEMLAHSDFKILPLRNEDNNRDPYIWLDVRNAEVFVDALHEHLVSIDPTNVQTYEKNRSQLKREITALDRKFEFGFRSIAAGQSWLYHDTQQYFEQSYAFKVRGILSLKQGDVADTMNILKIRNELSNLGGACLFVEEAMTQKYVDMAIDGTQTKLKTIDSFGLKLKAGPDLYISLMKKHFDTIAGCFKEIGAKYTGPESKSKL